LPGLIPEEAIIVGICCVQNQTQGKSTEVLGWHSGRPDMDLF